MVTTISFNGDLNFKAVELFSSELEEDRQIAEMAGQQIGATIEKLVPVLIYVDQQIGGIRGIEVVKDGNYTLVLGREGKWYSGMSGEKLNQDPTGWQHYILSKIVEGLEKIFAEATKKKEVHQAAVAKRRDLLNKIGAVIRGEAVPAAEK
ncbi:MAG: hypothetical protein HYT34_02345 [Candidatus Ryanbacteria bacterium]|nr:hypothetical protein [Candidatus Ryanbacteria bacterium]